MEFLGIGPLELLFIILIIIIVVGPRDISKTARSLGRGLNSLYKSDGWRTFNEVSKQFRGLPNRLAREAELAELQKAAEEIKETVVAAADPNLAAWTPAAKRVAGGTGQVESMAPAESNLTARAPDGKDRIDVPSSGPRIEPNPSPTAEGADSGQPPVPLTSLDEASTGQMVESRGAPQLPAP